MITKLRIFGWILFAVAVGCLIAGRKNALDQPWLMMSGYVLAVISILMSLWVTLLRHQAQFRRPSPPPDDPDDQEDDSSNPRK